MSVTDDIKARVDILDLIQSYNVPLKRAGRIYKAPCPFHSERSPSFVVYPESGTWRCFGACAEGGDIFSFVMKHENTDFKGALEILAHRAGIELKPRTSEQKDRDIALERMKGLVAESATFFNAQFNTAPTAAYARDYVQRRGLTDDTVERFLIGFAPDDWRQALTHLEALGYSEDEIIDAGVATRNEKGSVYDRFRNRLMIPIRDSRGAAIGFGARALAAEDNPKYLNSPQTSLFDKSGTLFAFDMARRTIRETETAVIVEGYMDALQAHQAGFSNVVAQMGTALTGAQLTLLARYAKKLILALDPDDAGVSATMRGLSVARQTLDNYQPVFGVSGTVLHESSDLKLDIRILTLPDGQDPDDLIRDEPEKWQGLVDKAQPIIDYVIEMACARVTPDMSLVDRKVIAQQTLPLLMESQHQIHESVQKLALKLRIPEYDLLRPAQTNLTSSPAAMKFRKETGNYRDSKRSLIDTRSLPGGSASVTPQPAALPVSGDIAALTFDLEGYVLVALVQSPDLWSLANRKLAQIASDRDLRLGALSADDFERPDYKEILNTFRRALEQFETEPLEYLYRMLPPSLYEELERLLHGPLQPIQEGATWVSVETKSILKERERMPAVLTRPEDEFVEKALQVRKRRLKRESMELEFMQHEHDDDPALARKIHYFRSARREIEQAIHEIKQSLR